MVWAGLIQARHGTGPTDSPDDDRTAALLAALVRQNAELLAEIKRLLARIAELEAKLVQPPKTPDNSSLAPSRGQKVNAEPPAAKPQRKGRPGVTRKLAETPDVTRRLYAESCACGAVPRDSGYEGHPQRPCPQVRAQPDRPDQRQRGYHVAL